MSWHEISLGDAIRMKHGFAFKGQYFSDSGEYVILTPGNFNEEGGFRLRSGKDRFYAGDIPEDYVLDEDDLIVAMTEQGAGLLGSSALIPEGGKYLHNQRLGLVQDLDQSVLDKKFLYYLFNTKQVRGQISGSATGTKVKHTAPERIYRVKVRVPTDVAEQRRISAILSTYDDLIENNRRRIQLLEQAVRLLYKEWFVLLRFPGHEHVKIKDGVPEGWEKGTVAGLGQIITGKTPSTKTPENFGNYIPFVKTPDMHRSRIIVETEEGLSERGTATQTKKTLPIGTILVACIGAKLGVVSITSRPCQTNQQINAVVPWKDYMTHYSLFVLMDIKPRLEAMGGGATMPNVNKTKFASIPILIPPTILLREFEEFAKSLFRQILLLHRQNSCLAKARDLLLPRLMNGEVGA